MSSSLEFNKIAAGVLCGGLLLMGVGKFAGVLVHPTDLEENAYPIELSGNGAAPAAAPSGPAPVEPILGLLATADVAAGQKDAKKCAACHSFDKGGPNKVGPNLWNVVNADKGHIDGFAYSDAIKSSGETPNWTYSSLNKFLKKPKDYAPGTKMNFAGIKKASDRADLVAYLRSLADSPAALPTTEEIQAAQDAYNAASGG
ncbi:cytochrome c family protein [Nisaea acidiphila]|uniref:Cytochrome c family protein n=1 Tax=Nisaea acidiphila TaxID=1862145 RepID=A0A9J7AM08_9PROT|nr:cytochrome c family protein [Nisaea acidiphila]UUX48199.1 cytochrome c family protein [Nisaea acidiphila]